MRLVFLASAALVILAARPRAGTESAAPVVAGAVVAIGGGGDVPEIVRRFISLSGGPDARILVVPISTGADDPGAAMADYFRKHGALNVGIWNPADAAAADLPESLAALSGARGLYFGGGVQSRGMAKLQGTRALAAIRALHAGGAVVGGSSAGAAILSAVMMEGGDVNGPLASGRSSTQEGLGVADDYVFDQHFLARSRFERLVNVLLDRPGLRGMGVDERTAAVLHGGRIEVVGLGQVVIVDPPNGVAARVVDGRSLSAAELVRFRVLIPGDVADRADPFADRRSR